MLLLFLFSILINLLITVNSQVCITSSTTTTTTTAAPTTCPAGWTLFQSYCYQFFSTAVTYATAITNCQALGSTSQLASVHSLAENTFLYNLSGMLSTWIAAIRTGTGIPDFSNTDGTPFDYTNWAVNEPSLVNVGGQSIEYCTNLQGVGSGATAQQWNDVPCAFMIPYTCKMPL